MDLNYKIEGGKELEARLKDLGSKMATSISNKALRKGANVIRDEMRSLVPIRSGRLKKSIKVKKDRFNRSNKTQTYTIGPSGPGAYIARFIEYGTSGHVVKIKSKKILAVSKAGEVFGREIKHPGVKAKPFIRPAYDTKKEAAVDTVASVIREEVRKHK